MNKMEQELEQLRRWKKEQMFVESGWDPQELGQMLGMPVGADIRANLKPRIRKLLDDLNTALATIGQLRSKYANDEAHLLRAEKDRDHWRRVAGEQMAAKHAAMDANEQLVNELKDLVSRFSG